MSRLFLVIALIFSLQVNATSLVMSPTDTIPKLTKAEYLSLSKKQNTTAIVLVSVGGAAFAGGIYFIALHLTAAEMNSWFEEETEPMPTGYYLLAIGGAILALCSIPVFKSSSANRRLAKTATVGLNIEKLNSIPTASITKTYFPSLRFTVRF